MVTATDPTRRVAPHAEVAAGAMASLLSLVTDPRGSADVREVAVALRDLAGTPERIAARRELPCPGGGYGLGWVPHRGA